MDFLITALLTALALLGHGALWVSFINRWNSFSLNHHVLRWVNRGSLVVCGVLALAIMWHATKWLGTPSRVFASRSDVPGVMSLYFMLCWTMAALTSSVWIYRRVFNDNIEIADHDSTALEGHRTMTVVHEELIDIAKLTGEDLAGTAKAKLCARVPGNQVFQMQLRTLELHLPNIPTALDGFSIVHLSDLHMAGHLRRPFYDEVVRRANDFDADVVLITGDILDRAPCLPWLEPTLGQLTSRHGTYFVLGNHDHRGCPPEEVRRTLTDAGLLDVGGGHHIFSMNGANVMLVGNEAPWEKSPVAIAELPHPPDDPNTLSIAVSHAPDQIAWASKNHFDLMLAGHTHGGQGRLPIIGPLLAPSRYGVKYASGTFVRRPTVLHVTRGICAMTPVRLNCPPELTKLVLRRS